MRCFFFSFFLGHSRKDGRQGEHLSRQVGEVSQDEDKAWLYDLDVFSAPGQKGDQEAKHKANEGTTKGHHKEGNCKGESGHRVVVRLRFLIEYLLSKCAQLRSSLIMG